MCSDQFSFNPYRFGPVISPSVNIRIESADTFDVIFPMWRSVMTIISSPLAYMFSWINGLGSWLP
jgi:hypothetical protein